MRHFLPMRRTVLGSSGNAAIEFALALPLLVTLVIGTTDYGLAIARQMQVQQAAQSGAQSAMLHGFDATKISSAVTNATAQTISAAPAPSESCGCPDGGAISAIACGSACPDGNTAGSYVTVSAQSVYTTLMPYPGIPATFTLTAQSVVRVQ